MCRPRVVAFFSEPLQTSIDKRLLGKSSVLETKIKTKPIALEVSATAQKRAVSVRQKRRGWISMMLQVAVEAVDTHVVCYVIKLLSASYYASASCELTSS